jgi:hypothetical protein
MKVAIATDWHRRQLGIKVAASIFQIVRQYEIEKHLKIAST